MELQIFCSHASMKALLFYVYKFSVTTGTIKTQIPFISRPRHDVNIDVDADLIHTLFL